MTCTTYTRSARTALRVSFARAPYKEIPFAELVSAQTAPGGAFWAPRPRHTTCS